MTRASGMRNFAKALLRNGQPAVGTWVTLGDTVGIEALGRAGFDWLVFDLEHTALSTRDLVHSCQAVSRFPVSPMTRICSLGKTEIKRVLAAGVWGLVVPDIRNRRELENVVRWSKYPPMGERGVGGVRGPSSFDVSGPEHLKVANEEILIVAQIESVGAVETLDDILSVKGLDACYVGLDDLSVSMGIPPDQRDRHPKFKKAVDRILEACRRHAVIPGIHGGTAASVNDRIAEGWLMVGVGDDLSFMINGAREAVSAVDRSAIPSQGG